VQTIKVEEFENTRTVQTIESSRFQVQNHLSAFGVWSH